MSYENPGEQSLIRFAEKVLALLDMVRENQRGKTGNPARSLPQAPVLPQEVWINPPPEKPKPDNGSGATRKTFRSTAKSTGSPAECSGSMPFWQPTTASCVAEALSG
jgi:hypothetical protein